MGGLCAILGDIKLSHSVFALPFAMVGLLLGTRGAPPSPRVLVLVLVALVCARSAAMAFNRLADHRYDATNPRTAGRALPAGRVSRRAMGTFAAASAAGFLLAAAGLGRTCLRLAPLVLVVLLAYSLTKRVTKWAHAFVGLALALAPPAAYLAARGEVGEDVRPVLWLAASVLLWVGGFDVLYACQDVEHDRREGLHSLPAAWGVPRALAVARLAHAGMLAALATALAGAGLGALSWVALALVGALLLVEHGLVAGGRLERIPMAFFTLNGVVGLVFGALVCWDLMRP